MQRYVFLIFILAILGGGVYYAFSQIEEETGRAEEISLYYYNQEKDKDEEGNVLCSSRGLVPVKASLPEKNTIESAVQLLIQGSVPEEAESQGITTEFPLEGFKLEKAELKEGTLKLTFKDPENKTSGGACRVNILRLQIVKTAEQFPEVREVLIQPENIFQP